MHLYRPIWMKESSCASLFPNGQRHGQPKHMPYFPMDLRWRRKRDRFALPSLSPTNIGPTACLNALPSGTTLSMEIDKKDPSSNYFWNHHPDLTLSTRGRRNSRPHCFTNEYVMGYTVAVQDNQTNPHLQPTSADK